MGDKENFEPNSSPQKLFFVPGEKRKKSIEKRRYEMKTPLEFAKIDHVIIVDETEADSLACRKSSRKKSEVILPEIKTCKKEKIRKVSDDDVDDIVVFKEDEVTDPPTVMNRVKWRFWDLCRCVIPSRG